MATTRVFTAISGRWFVESNDPEIPTAKVEIQEEGGTAYAHCPCGAKLRLEQRFGDQLDGIEYQLHYVNEHLPTEAERAFASFEHLGWTLSDQERWEEAAS